MFTLHNKPRSLYNVTRFDIVIRIKQKTISPFRDCHVFAASMKAVPAMLLLLWRSRPSWFARSLRLSSQTSPMGISLSHGLRRRKLHIPHPSSSVGSRSFRCSAFSPQSFALRGTPEFILQHFRVLVEWRCYYVCKTYNSRKINRFKGNAKAHDFGRIGRADRLVKIRAWKV